MKAAAAVTIAAKFRSDMIHKNQIDRTPRSDVFTIT